MKTIPGQINNQTKHLIEDRVFMLREGKVKLRNKGGTGKESTAIINAAFPGHQIIANLAIFDYYVADFENEGMWIMVDEGEPCNPDIPGHPISWFFTDETVSVVDTVGKWINAKERMPPRTMDEIFVRHLVTNNCWEKKTGDYGLVSDLIENGWETVEWLDENVPYTPTDYQKAFELLYEALENSNMSLSILFASKDINDKESIINCMEQSNKAIAAAAPFIKTK